MLGDRDLNVVITPLHRDRRAKNPRQEAPARSATDAPPPAAEDSPA
jgi:hypothetical protein